MSTRKKKASLTITTASPAPSMSEKSVSNYLPTNGGSISLPDAGLKIGEYVYTALHNLELSGFAFSDRQIDEMCTSEWSKKTFHTVKPFMKRYIEGETDNKGADGSVRFKAEPFDFGGEKVYISKEWYERQRVWFNEWYTNLFALKSNDSQ